MSPAVALRIAAMADLPELRRLRLSSAPDAPTLPAHLCRRYVLVVDSPFGGLAAAVIVALEPPQAHLEALALDERYASPALEARLIAVAEALGQAFGCGALDVRTRYAA